ncbi:hypothetical protein V1512DRAFT_261447 [Lipomyces arxii]|uniref:uncharacterized protein n=1 Tax=Lipomyces arxii TaxID=56418 RepID=UPI0034CECC94
MMNLAQLQTLAVVLAPFLLPRIISRIQRFRHNGSLTETGSRKQIQSLEVRDKLLIILLLLAGIASVAQTAIELNIQSENLFTASRLSILTPTDVILKTMQKLKTNTEHNMVLLSHLTSKRSRAIYAAFGEDALVNCSWCEIGSDDSYRIYVLSTLLWPFLAQVVLVKVATLLQPKLKAVQLYATTALVIGAGVAVWRLIAFSPTANIHPRAPDTVHYLLHDLLVQRNSLLFVFDILLLVPCYLVGTNRLTLTTDDIIDIMPQQREIMQMFGQVEQQLDVVFQKTKSTNLVEGLARKNITLRQQTAEFWNGIDDQERRLLNDTRIQNAIDNAKQSSEYSRWTTESEDFANVIISAGKRNRKF